MCNRCHGNCGCNCACKERSALRGICCYSYFPIIPNSRSHLVAAYMDSDRRSGKHSAERGRVSLPEFGYLHRYDGRRRTRRTQPDLRLATLASLRWTRRLPVKVLILQEMIQRALRRQSLFSFGILRKQGRYFGGRS